MIDTQRETLLKMDEAAKHLKRTKKTVYEWARPVRPNGQPKPFWLETAKQNTRRVTSVEAIQRFTERCSQGEMQDQFRMLMPMSQVDQAARVAQTEKRIKDKYGF